MLPWFNPLALYEQCYKLATVGHDTETDVFLYNCSHKWQQLIDYRLQEVSLMVAWGLAQPEPTIYYPNPQTPLMPPLSPGRPSHRNATPARRLHRYRFIRHRRQGLRYDSVQACTHAPRGPADT